ncbi:photosystem II manganese-stabilizing polypeptide [Leptolyngbya sp. FACHB-261]|uniref:photosystem II manganese-stabilizing polypeptide n=1 Tax=Leptolyngbya sp. FACHB-261 TaxID=2692806 RepID=UPI001682E20A|nr:photosystem II manganese-stabilizing polypeptide [Leptolyngbya sp. FACHB-261]MBD2104611.1 photosystem II manganese-stabilizing polypeptide [Leptolyngbya sp. FACHB-261]
MRYRALITALIALCFGLLTACSDAPTSSGPLTYDQIRGTGLANNCPQLEGVSRGNIPIDSGKSYQISDLCLQPTEFFVKEEPTNKRQAAQFVPGKLLTRSTSTIAYVKGKLEPTQAGTLRFVEEDGLDYQPITVQLPGGERVALLFTVKGLVAETQPGLSAISTSTDFEGDFRVNTYRTANFLDPKGRGLTAGYDNAVALPAQSDREDLTEKNIKRELTLPGHLSLQVARVDNSTGEIAGTFESEQTSDTDMGAEEPREVKIRGLFYARVDPSEA